MAILCGIAAARQRNFERLGWDFNRKGYDGAPRLRVIASTQAHGTVSKAIALLGFGSDNIELFNLKTDLGEQTNIAADHPEVVAKIRAAIKKSHVPSELWKVRKSKKKTKKK